MKIPENASYIDSTEGFFLASEGRVFRYSDGLDAFVEIFIIDEPKVKPNIGTVDDEPR